jgi:hypothetical protein
MGQQSAQHLDRGRFAHTVAPHQGDNFALAYAQIDPEQRLTWAVGRSYPGHF